MRAMKDSGIEWIGEIPREWDVVKIKHLANHELNSFTDGDWIDSPYIVDEGIRYLTSGNIGDGEYKEQGNGHITEETFIVLNCTYAYPGDLVFSRLNTPYGRSCILPDICPEYVLAVDNVILRTNEDKRFISYLTQCAGYHHEVEGKANGTAMKRISRTDLGNISLPVASQNEQSHIADYLDKKCAEIDALIAAKEKTNALLKEQRQSIIYEAVTKGLDPTIPMKDSGIEWIGEIPEGWDIHKIKTDFIIVAGATPKSGNSDFWDGNIAWITPADYATEDVYISCGHKKITQEGLDSCATSIIPENSIIFSKRAPVGLVAINTVPLCTNQGCLSCVPKAADSTKFYYYAMSAFTEQFDLFASGTTFKEISADAFANFKLPHPSSDIQNVIVDYLDSKCSEIDSIITANNETIKKLKEYRQSVIYEAVTGKIEV